MVLLLRPQVYHARATGGNQQDFTTEARRHRGLGVRIASIRVPSDKAIALEDPRCEHSVAFDGRILRVSVPLW